jgi:hypothetical protein
MIKQSTDTYSGRNVFHVFADRLRRRTATGLAGQAIVAGAAAGLIVLAFPAWWPVAAAVAAICLAAVWGIIDRKHGMSQVRLLPRAIAILTAGLVILSAVGIALAAFTGDSRSPYGTCYGSDGRAFACDATGARR